MLARLRFGGMSDDEIRDARVLDPACGDGTLLKAAINEIESMTGCDRQTAASQCEGWEIDPDAARRAGQRTGRESFWFRMTKFRPVEFALGQSRF